MEPTIYVRTRYKLIRNTYIPLKYALYIRGIQSSKGHKDHTMLPLCLVQHLTSIALELVGSSFVYFCLSTMHQCLAFKEKCVLFKVKRYSCAFPLQNKLSTEDCSFEYSFGHISS